MFRVTPPGYYPSDRKVGNLLPACDWLLLYKYRKKKHAHSRTASGVHILYFHAQHPYGLTTVYRTFTCIQYGLRYFSLSVLQYNLESSPNGQTRSSSSGGGAAGASKGAYSVRTEEEGCYCTRDGFLSCPGSTRFLTAETRSSRARRAMKPTGSSRVHVAV